jgi:hypothetical protein
MTRARFLAPAVLLLGLGVVAYRELPAILGSRVFSNDAWPLLSDSRYLVSHPTATLIPCSSFPTCYYAYWPAPTVLTAVFQQVTGLPLLNVPAALTLFFSALFAMGIALFARLTFSRGDSAVGGTASGIAQSLPALFAVLALAVSSWLLNTFYAGYKAEAEAMPLCILALFLFTKGLRNPKAAGGGARWLAVIALYLGILLTHHFSAFLAESAMAGGLALALLRTRFRSLNAQAGAVVAASVGITILYYALQGFRGLTEYYPPGFTETLLAYNAGFLVLAAITRVREARAVARVLVPLMFALAALVMVFPGRILPGIPRISPLELALAVGPAGVFAFASLGYVRLLREAPVVQSVLGAWIIAAFSLVVYSTFDGNAILLYRGLVAAATPSLVFAGYEILRSLEVFRGSVARSAPGTPRNRGASGSKRPRSFWAGWVALSLLIVATALGVVASLTYYGKSVYTGETWAYPESELTAIHSLSELLGSQSIAAGVNEAGPLGFYQGNISAVESPPSPPPAPGYRLTGLVILLGPQELSGNFFGYGLGWNVQSMENVLHNDSIYYNSGSYIALGGVR